VTTSSGAGLFGSVSQGNYSAAKAGIAAFTVVAAAELGRYGILVNGIAPSARSRMTEEAFADMMRKPEDGFDAMDPANVSPVVVWLGSTLCGISGRMFETAGGQLSVAGGWQHGAVFDKGSRYEPAEIGAIVDDLIADAPAPADVYGS
jgi:NAD(P)-dependent dehydrogenase (short-subunit alcohol dehydrogenase family)